MRIRIEAVIFGFGLLVGLIGYCPAGALLSVLLPPGFEWQQSTGSIWAGTARGLQYGSIPLGDMAWRSKPAWGGLVFHLDFAGRLANGRGRLGLYRSRVELSALDLRLDSAAMSFPDRNIRPVKADIVVEDAALVMDRSQQFCRSAGGRIHTDLLARAGTSLGWSIGLLTGELACSGSELLIELADREQKCQIELRLDPAASDLPVSIRIDTDEEKLISLLGILGFVVRDGSYILSAEPQSWLGKRLDP